VIIVNGYMPTDGDDGRSDCTLENNQQACTGEMRYLRFLEHEVLERDYLWKANDVHIDVFVVDESATVQNRAVRRAEHVLEGLQRFTHQYAMKVVDLVGMACHGVMAFGSRCSAHR